MRIELCGPLGVGKTTLAMNLAENLGATLIREPVEAHPFLNAFYQNTNAFAFEKNLFFLLDYIHQVKKCQTLHQTESFVFDHSAVVHRSYAALNQASACEKSVYHELDRLTEGLGAPDLLINLICPSDIIMERIRKRGRGFEAEISLSYVTALNTEIQHQVDRVRHYIPVLNLDAQSYDFDKSPKDNERIAESIRLAIADASSNIVRKTAPAVKEAA